MTMTLHFYQVEAEGDLLFEARLDVLALIFRLHQDAVDRIIRECSEEPFTCVIHASRLNPLIPKYPELTISYVPPWKRLLTEEQMKNIWEAQIEDVDKDYAEYPLDDMSTNEILAWQKEWEKENAENS